MGIASVGLLCKFLILTIPISAEDTIDGIDINRSSRHVNTALLASRATGNEPLSYPQNQNVPLDAFKKQERNKPRDFILSSIQNSAEKIKTKQLETLCNFCSKCPQRMKHPVCSQCYDFLEDHLQAKNYHDLTKDLPETQAENPFGSIPSQESPTDENVSVPIRNVHNKILTNLLKNHSLRNKIKTSMLHKQHALISKELKDISNENILNIHGKKPVMNMFSTHSIVLGEDRHETEDETNNEKQESILKQNQTLDVSKTNPLRTDDSVYNKNNINMGQQNIGHDSHVTSPQTADTKPTLMNHSNNMKNDESIRNNNYPVQTDEDDSKGTEQNEFGSISDDFSLLGATERNKNRKNQKSSECVGNQCYNNNPAPYAVLHNVRVPLKKLCPIIQDHYISSSEDLNGPNAVYKENSYEQPGLDLKISDGANKKNYNAYGMEMNEENIDQKYFPNPASMENEDYQKFYPKFPSTNQKSISPIVLRNTHKSLPIYPGNPLMTRLGGENPEENKKIEDDESKIINELITLIKNDQVEDKMKLGSQIDNLKDLHPKLRNEKLKILVQSLLQEDAPSLDRNGVNNFNNMNFRTEEKFSGPFRKLQVPESDLNRKINEATKHAGNSGINKFKFIPMDGRSSGDAVHGKTFHLSNQRENILGQPKQNLKVFLESPSNNKQDTDNVVVQVPLSSLESITTDSKGIKILGKSKTSEDDSGSTKQRIVTDSGKQIDLSILINYLKSPGKDLNRNLNLTDLINYLKTNSKELDRNIDFRNFIDNIKAKSETMRLIKNDDPLNINAKLIPNKQNNVHGNKNIKITSSDNNVKESEPLNTPQRNMESKDQRTTSSLMNLQENITNINNENLLQEGNKPGKGFNGRYNNHGNSNKDIKIDLKDSQIKNFIMNNSGTAHTAVIKEQVNEKGNSNENKLKHVTDKYGLIVTTENNPRKNIGDNKKRNINDLLQKILTNRGRSKREADQNVIEGDFPGIERSQGEYHMNRNVPVVSQTLHGCDKMQQINYGNENQQKSSMNYQQSSPERYQLSPGHYQLPPNHYQNFLERYPEYYPQPLENYRRPPENHRRSPEQHQYPPEHQQSSTDHEIFDNPNQNPNLNTQYYNNPDFSHEIELLREKTEDPRYFPHRTPKIAQRQISTFNNNKNANRRGSQIELTTQNVSELLVKLKQKQLSSQHYEAIPGNDLKYPTNQIEADNLENPLGNQDINSNQKSEYLDRSNNRNVETNGNFPSSNFDHQGRIPKRFPFHSHYSAEENKNEVIKEIPTYILDNIPSKTLQDHKNDKIIDSKNFRNLETRAINMNKLMDYEKLENTNDILQQSKNHEKSNQVISKDAQPKTENSSQVVNNLQNQRKYSEENSDKMDDPRLRSEAPKIFKNIGDDLKKFATDESKAISDNIVKGWKEMKSIPKTFTNKILPEVEDNLKKLRSNVARTNKNTGSLFDKIIPGIKSGLTDFVEKEKDLISGKYSDTRNALTDLAAEGKDTVIDHVLDKITPEKTSPKEPKILPNLTLRNLNMKERQSTNIGRIGSKNLLERWRNRNFLPKLLNEKSDVSTTEKVVDDVHSNITKLLEKSNIDLKHRHGGNLHRALLDQTEKMETIMKNEDLVHDIIDTLSKSGEEIKNSGLDSRLGTPNNKEKVSRFINDNLSTSKKIRNLLNTHQNDEHGYVTTTPRIDGATKLLDVLEKIKLEEDQRVNKLGNLGADLEKSSRQRVLGKSENLEETNEEGRSIDLKTDEHGYVSTTPNILMESTKLLDVLEQIQRKSLEVSKQADNSVIIKLLPKNKNVSENPQKSEIHKESLEETKKNGDQIVGSSRNEEIKDAIHQIKISQNSQSKTNLEKSEINDQSSTNENQNLIQPQNGPKMVTNLFGESPRPVADLYTEENIKEILAEKERMDMEGRSNQNSIRINEGQVKSQTKPKFEKLKQRLSEILRETKNGLVGKSSEERITNLRDEILQAINEPFLRYEMCHMYNEEDDNGSIVTNTQRDVTNDLENIKKPQNEITSSTHNEKSPVDNPKDVLNHIKHDTQENVEKIPEVIHEVKENIEPLIQTTNELSKQNDLTSIPHKLNDGDLQAVSNIAPPDFVEETEKFNDETELPHDDEQFNMKKSKPGSFSGKEKDGTEKAVGTSKLDEETREPPKITPSQTEIPPELIEELKKALERLNNEIKPQSNDESVSTPNEVQSPLNSEILEKLENAPNDAGDESVPPESHSTPKTSKIKSQTGSGPGELNEALGESKNDFLLPIDNKDDDGLKGLSFVTNSPKNIDADDAGGSIITQPNLDGLEESGNQDVDENGENLKQTIEGNNDGGDNYQNKERPDTQSADETNPMNYDRASNDAEGNDATAVNDDPVRATEVIPSGGDLEEKNIGFPKVEEMVHLMENPSDENATLGNILEETPLPEDKVLVSYKKLKDMYIVGDGFKLPLAVKEGDDGDFEMNIDFNKFCDESCKKHNLINHDPSTCTCQCHKQNEDPIVGVERRVQTTEEELKKITNDLIRKSEMNLQESKTDMKKLQDTYNDLYEYLRDLPADDLNRLLHKRRASGNDVVHTESAERRGRHTDGRSFNSELGLDDGRAEENQLSGPVNLLVGYMIDEVLHQNVNEKQQNDDDDKFRIELFGKLIDFLEDSIGKKLD